MRYFANLFALKDKVIDRRHSMKLFIAEKPSLAQAIAAGIGNGKKSDGYISVNGGKEIVTWCYGHILVRLNPDEYAEKYRSW